MKEISKRKSNMAYSPLYSQHNTKSNDEPRLKWAKTIEEDEKIDKKHRLQIKKAFLHGWEAYATHVWGADELHPQSMTRKDWLGEQGTMIVDSITTMIIMGALDEEQKPKRQINKQNKNSDQFIINKEEYEEETNVQNRLLYAYTNSVDWVKKQDLNEFYLKGNGKTISLFETGIRILAGFISAFDLSYGFDQDQDCAVFLRQAEGIGDLLIQYYEDNSITSIPINSQIHRGRQTMQFDLNSTKIRKVNFKKSYIKKKELTPAELQQKDKEDKEIKDQKLHDERYIGFEERIRRRMKIISEITQMVEKRKSGGNRIGNNIRNVDRNRKVNMNQLEKQRINYDEQQPQQQEQQEQEQTEQHEQQEEQQEKELELEEYDDNFDYLEYKYDDDDPCNSYSSEHSALTKQQKQQKALQCLRQQWFINPDPVVNMRRFTNLTQTCIQRNINGKILQKNNLNLNINNQMNDQLNQYNNRNNNINNNNKYNSITQPNQFKGISASIAEFALLAEFAVLSDRTVDPHYLLYQLRSMQTVMTARKLKGINVNKMIDFEEGRINDEIENYTNQDILIQQISYMNQQQQQISSQSNIPSRVQIGGNIQKDGEYFTKKMFVIGAGSDSFFEYLIKTAMYMDEKNEVQKDIKNGQINNKQIKQNTNKKIYRNNNKNNQIQQNYFNQEDKQQQQYQQLWNQRNVIQSQINKRWNVGSEILMEGDGIRPWRLKYDVDQQLNTEDNDDDINDNNKQETNRKLNLNGEQMNENNLNLNKPSSQQQSDSPYSDVGSLAEQWIGVMESFYQQTRIEKQSGLQYIRDQEFIPWNNINQNEQEKNNEKINLTNVNKEIKNGENINNEIKNQQEDNINHQTNNSQSNGDTWQHLSCFAGGNIALGAYYLNNYKLPQWSEEKEQEMMKLEHDINQSKINNKLNKLKMENEQNQNMEQQQEQKQEKHNKIKQHNTIIRVFTHVISKLFQFIINIFIHHSHHIHQTLQQAQPSLSQLIKQHNSLEIEKRLSVLFSFGANVTKTCAQMYLSNNVTGLGGENVEFGASMMNDDGKVRNQFRSGSEVMDNNNNQKEIDNKRMNNNIQQQDEQSNMNKEQQQQTPSNDDILPFWKRGNSSYILRPEVVESIFYLYRITGDKRYKDMNWQIFRNIEKHSRCPPRILTADGDDVENITVCQSFNNNIIINQSMDQIKNEQNDDQQCIGYTTLSSINQQDSIRRMNEMPSFFFAETLKYIYLTFADANEIVPLDEWVFTTEAHPILRRARLAVEKFW